MVRCLLPCGLCGRMRTEGVFFGVVERTGVIFQDKKFLEQGITMGQDTLVIDEGENDAGSELIGRISETLPVKLAFWLKPTENPVVSLHCGRGDR